MGEAALDRALKVVHILVVLFVGLFACLHEAMGQKTGWTAAVKLEQWKVPEFIRAELKTLDATRRAFVGELGLWDPQNNSMDGLAKKVFEFLGFMPSSRSAQVLAANSVCSIELNNSGINSINGVRLLVPDPNCLIEVDNPNRGSVRQYWSTRRVPLGSLQNGVPIRITIWSMERVSRAAARALIISSNSAGTPRKRVDSPPTYLGQCVNCHTSVAVVIITGCALLLTISALRGMLRIVPRLRTAIQNRNRKGKAAMPSPPVSP